MNLEVPFSYSIAYVHKGLRKPDHTRGFATALVDVPFADGPVVFEIGCPFDAKDKHGHVSPFHAPKGETVRVYRAEEAFWVEICPAAEAQAQISVRNEMKRDPFAVHFRSGEVYCATDRHYHDDDGEKLKTRDQLEKEKNGLRSWDDQTDQNLVRTVLQRRAVADIRIIDGRMCMRVSEPVLDFVWHSNPKPPPPPKKKYVPKHRRGWSYNAEPAVPAWVPPPADAPADGHHMVIEQVSQTTPAGFTLSWDLPVHRAVRWRLDQQQAAYAYLTAPVPGSDDGTHADRSMGDLQPPAVTVAAADMSVCKHEGVSLILRNNIDRFRRALLEEMPAMDRVMLAMTIEMEHSFERDGGRLTPELIAMARRLLDAHPSSPLALFSDGVGDMVGDKRVHHHRFAGPDVENAMEELVSSLALWDARNQADCEWVDRMLPAPVLPAVDYDVVEIPTLQRAQDLVDAGCDPAVLDAVRRIPGGDMHVICLEGQKGDLTGFAASVRTIEGELAVDRVFTPNSPKASVVEGARRRFEAFVIANIAASMENDAIAGLSI